MAQDGAVQRRGMRENQRAAGPERAQRLGHAPGGAQRDGRGVNRRERDQRMRLIVNPPRHHAMIDQHGLGPPGRAGRREDAERRRRVGVDRSERNVPAPRRHAVPELIEPLGGLAGGRRPRRRRRLAAGQHAQLEAAGERRGCGDAPAREPQRDNERAKLIEAGEIETDDIAGAESAALGLESDEIDQLVERFVVDDRIVIPDQRGPVGQRQREPPKRFGDVHAAAKAAALRRRRRAPMSPATPAPIKVQVAGSGTATAGDAVKVP